MRSMRAQTAVLALVFLLGAAHSQTPTDSPDSLVSALQAEVEALEGGRAEVLGARIAWPQMLREFYAQRSFAAAWRDPQASIQLRRALDESRLDGLDPADYHLPLLQTLATESAAPQTSAAVRAKYDMLQTDALIRLAYHLSFGKVDPTNFDAQWNYVRTLASMNVERAIEAALSGGDVYEKLAALRPKHPLYLSLKKELARYRSLETTGDAPIVPKGATLKPDSNDSRVPALRARLIARGDLVMSDTQSTLYDAATQAAMRRFQARMGLKDDAVVGPRTLEELNAPIADRIRQLRVNLDRGRVVLHDLPNEFVVVNIAGYRIYFVRGNEIIWQSRVQVGKPYRRTPIFRSNIDYLVWNPTWTVPPGIVKNDILPQAQRDPHAITRKGLDVLAADGRKLDPTTIDWSKYRGSIPYTLRQEPGPSNALGRVKFMFANPYAVYLHDTPSRSLFEADERSFSSGCVRVERPIELAQLLLKDSTKWNETVVTRLIESERTTNVTLPEKVPVLLVYWTAWVDAENRVNFRRDIYGQDVLWAKGLDAPFSIRKQPLIRKP